MGAKIVGFILYLALSYGVIYLLISKRFLRGLNLKEPQLKAAILVAIVLIIAVGTMLVGPLPMVLLVVALVAFIDYVRSSEALAATASDRTPNWHLLPSLPSLIGSIGWLRQRLTKAQAYGWLRRGLTVAQAYEGFDRVRHQVVPAARRALAGGVESLSGYVRTFTRALNRNSRKSRAGGDDHTDTVQAIPDHDEPPPPAPPPPPPLSLAEGHGLYAVHTALAPTKQVERAPTRDEAKRLLDRLEGRA